MRRRSVLLGMGTAAAGSGIVFGSGAFTQVQAERDLTIGIDEDSEALLALKANEDIASVYEASDSGELVINTEVLDDGDRSTDGAGFNVGSTVQIGQTTDETFGNEVSSSEYAFKLVNNFAEDTDDSGDATSSSSGDFDGVLDVAIDLTAFNPDNNDATVDFVGTRSEGGGQTAFAGERTVFDNVAPNEEIYIAIRIDTDSPSTELSDLSGDVVFQAGSDLTADDFPNEQNIDNNEPGSDEILNVNTGNTKNSLRAAVEDADEGDTIRVGDGTFSPTDPNVDGDVLVMDKANLTLEGPNAGIDGANETARGDEATINGPVLIGADNVTVDGVEINDADANFGGPLPGPGAVQFAAGEGYGDTADGATIRNNVIVAGINNNGENFGFYVGDDVNNVTITQNLFDEGGNSATTGGVASGISYSIDFNNNTQKTTNTAPSDTTISG